MPVFHTKTIQMILEPVANQVSQLVLLHEYSEGGQNPIPDLSAPIHGVSRAVENLVMVGRETTATSKDPVLQQEMPLALDRVSEASSLLLETSRLLKLDPYSADARRKLIDGSRGILQGTSTLLLVSDQAEVRKILRTCKAVYECLAIAEVIETLDDLIVYVKNMTPGLTQMTREVENRRSDLSHHVHSDMLQKALDKVKSYTPIVISSIKTFVSTLQSGMGRAEAVENRNYVISKVMEAIQEIMRVLQLTSYDEDEWESDELTITKRLKYQLDENRAAAFDWLNNPNADSGALGQVLLRQSLDDAQKMAERCPDPQERNRLMANIGDMDTMLKQLNQLRRNGMGHTPQSLKLAENLSSAFDHLLRDVSRTADEMEGTGMGRPAHTVLGKVDQAQRWLNNPYARDGDAAASGISHGEQATRLVIAEGRRVADVTTNQQLKGHIYRICDDVEMLTNRLSDLRRGGHADNPECHNIAHDLSRKLDALKAMIQDGVIWQVADCFADTMTPIRLLHQAAINPPNSPNRDQVFQQRALDFIDHANNVINVSKKVASTNTGNKQYSEDISALAVQLQDGTPQVVHSAKIVLTYPGDQAVMEHFELLKKEWTSTLEQLSGLVDEVIDTGTFIKASEAGMIHHAERAEIALNQYNIPEFSSNTSQIVRRADRVARVADGDAASSDDPHFVEKVGAAVKQLRTHLSPVVVSAKEAAVNPQEKQAVTRWKTSNQALITAVGKVHHAILVVPEHHRGRYEDLNSSGSPLPEMTHLSLNNSVYDRLDSTSSTGSSVFAYYEEEQGPPRPPLPAEGGAPPRPPPPAETDDEDESFSFPAPQANQPIMIAAHELHLEAKQWSSKDNELIAAAKRMAKLMGRLSQLVRGECGSKIELIDTAKAIALASDEVACLATKLAKEITDRRMRNALLQVCERIPTIGTQLKVLTTVKATMLGAQEEIEFSEDGSEINCGSEEDQEATEMLVGNAQNLMQSVRETVRAAEAAAIKMRVDSGYSIRWLRKRPWYS